MDRINLIIMGTAIAPNVSAGKERKQRVRRNELRGICGDDDVVDGGGFTVVLDKKAVVNENFTVMAVHVDGVGVSGGITVIVVV